MAIWENIPKFSENVNRNFWAALQAGQRWLWSGQGVETLNAGYGRAGA
jgi:hypothetical protein